MKHTISKFFILGILSLHVHFLAAQDIEIVSSSKLLNDAFGWAKVKARSYVMTNKKGVVNKSEQGNGTGAVDYIPCYWAGYPHRTAFYSRDFCHQMSGAHLLGLQRENLEMMRSFAGSANEQRLWYPLWAINFDGSAYSLDYRSDKSFVREVPAVFELVEKVYKQYQWTGDKTLLSDPVIWNFCTKVVTDFITLHDTNIPNGVAEGDGSGNIFKGVATYNEGHGLYYIEAGDGIACQYQALLSYAKLLDAKGDKPAAATFFKRANDLRQYFNTEWSRLKGDSGYALGISKDRVKLEGYGRETSLFMPMKFITNPSERNSSYLDFISRCSADSAQRPENIESLTYLPDTYFAYNRVEEGWYWMKHIIGSLDKPHVVELAGKNGDYPEVSFTLISSVVENMMGVEPNAAAGSISTIARLPLEVPMLGVNNIPIGGHRVSVLHEGAYKTTVKHTDGVKSLKCNIRFYGHIPFIKVNGKRQKARFGMLNGVEISSVDAMLALGEAVVAVAEK